MSVVRHRYRIEGWGTGELWYDEDAVVAHEIEWGRFDVREVDGGAPLSELALEVVERVRHQLAGRRTSYADLKLDLGWCTPFQTELARALGAVRWGELVSYGDLATLAGRPGAARAAGSFCARNRFALLLPCHRVVAASGLGGYGEAGVELKRRLLALEGIEP